MDADQQLSFAVRTDDAEVGIVGTDLVVRKLGGFVGLLASFGLADAEQRLPLAQATVHYSDGVLRIYRNGQPWMFLEGVEDHYVATDLAEEVRRFRSAS